MKSRYPFVRAAVFAASLACGGGAMAQAVNPADLAQMVRHGISELSVVDWAAEAEGARVVADMHYRHLDALVRSGKSELARANWAFDAAAPAVAVASANAELGEMARYGISEFVREEAAPQRLAGVAFAVTTR